MKVYKTKKATQPDKKYIAKMFLFFSALIGLILISLTSIWLNRVIFNTERFTAVTTAAFSEPSSRESIGSLVASRVFEDRPLLRATLSERLSGYVASLLGTETAVNAVERLAQETQLLFTSPQRDPVVLDLSSIKPLVASAQELVRSDDSQRRLSVEDIPDSITIIDTTKLPNFHTASMYVHIAGAVALVLAILMGVYWIIRGGKQSIYKRSRIIMLVIIAAAALAVVIGPLAEPAFVSLGRDAPSQSLLRNLYESYTLPFRNQALFLGAMALFLFVAITLWREFKKRYKLIVKVNKK
jgi:hypothetical protein